MSAPSSSYFTQRTVMGTAAFVLTFRYNSRMGLWIFDAADANNNPIMQGLPILTQWPVFQRYYNRITGALPPGILMALDLTGQGRDPSLNTFGGDIPLTFFQP